MNQDKYQNSQEIFPCTVKGSPYSMRLPKYENSEYAMSNKFFKLSPTLNLLAKLLQAN